MATQDPTFFQSISDLFGGAGRDATLHAERCADIRRNFSDMRDRIERHIDDLSAKSPSLRAQAYVTGKLQDLVAAREKRSQAVDAAHKRMSWWQKLNAEPVDFAAIDKCIANLTRSLREIDASGDVAKVKAHYRDICSRSIARLDQAEAMALQTVPASRRSDYDGNQVAKASLWLAALSVPVSAWGDFSSAGDIYDTLRQVNGNFSALSDSEIWMQSLMMPSESLAGLISLSKGAHFEGLVAESTGGTLFAEFNHPDTDIMIDGIAYQIKATDSVDYINSVPDNIPVISTSEVALESGAIDSGFLLADIDTATELALGGSILDFNDTAFDAMLTGVGGLGVIATVRGVNHALRTYDKSQDNSIEAIAGGVGVAITGTAKSFVDTAELGYKVLSSRPSRFAGRQVLNVAKWSGKKLVGKPKKDGLPEG